MSSKLVVAAAAAALFAAGTVATVANAQGSLKCGGVNACKGQTPARRPVRHARA